MNQTIGILWNESPSPTRNGSSVLGRQDLNALSIHFATEQVAVRFNREPFGEKLVVTIPTDLQHPGQGSARPTRIPSTCPLSQAGVINLFDYRATENAQNQRTPFGRKLAEMSSQPDGMIVNRQAQSVGETPDSESSADSLSAISTHDVRQKPYQKVLGYRENKGWGIPFLSDCKTRKSISIKGFNPCERNGEQKKASLHGESNNKITQKQSDIGRKESNKFDQTFWNTDLPVVNDSKRAINFPFEQTLVSRTSQAFGTSDKKIASPTNVLRDMQEGDSSHPFLVMDKTGRPRLFGQTLVAKKVPGNWHVGPKSGSTDKGTSFQSPLINESSK